MNRDNILTADVLDIIFDGRNKAYGAYNLRKTYNERIRYALLGMAAFSFLFFLSIVINFSKKHQAVIEVGPEINLTKELIDKPKPLTPPPPPAPAPKPQQMKVETRIFTHPFIVEDNKVIDPPPTMESLDKVKIGLQNIEGKEPDGIITPPVEASTIAGAGLTAHKADDVNNDFKSIQIPAEFFGGKDQWMRFLERNLNREAPTDAGAPAGRYTVAVSFKVDEHGNLSDIVAENNPGFGTAEEAVRVIKKGPSWKPAIQKRKNCGIQGEANNNFCGGCAIKVDSRKSRVERG